jgi:hypothetical protein
MRSTLATCFVLLLATPFYTVAGDDKVDEPTVVRTGQVSAVRVPTHCTPAADSQYP